jgi:hypothetical protein
VASTGRKPLYHHLYFQVVCAILIGILLGHFYPALAVKMQPTRGGLHQDHQDADRALDMALQRHLARTSDAEADAPEKALA